MHDSTACFPDTPVRPAFDPELVAPLAVLRAGVPSLSAETLEVWRRAALEGRKPEGVVTSDAVRVEEHMTDGHSEEREVPLSLVRPIAQTGPLPVICYMHGGGTVLGDRWSGVDPFLRYVVEGLAILVTIEYRLAPEHPDPAPAEDCYAGLAWVAQNAKELGVDPGRMLVAGVSAGGGLAAGVALMARDRGFPHLSHQVLLCPMLDDRFETASSRMLNNEGAWDRGASWFAWSALLGDRRGGPDVSYYAAPARVADPAGLPHTYIDVGSAEGFRDECLVYAQRLSEAGVSVDLHMFAGGFHGYPGVVPKAAISRATIACRDEFMRRAIRPADQMLAEAGDG